MIPTYLIIAFIILCFMNIGLLYLIYMDAKLIQLGEKVMDEQKEIIRILKDKNGFRERHYRKLRDEYNTLKIENEMLKNKDSSNEFKS